MDFRLNESHRLLKNTIAEFAEKELKPKAIETSERLEIPWSTVRRAAELGIMGLTVPEKYGGMGQGGFEAVLVCEEVARVCPSTSMVLMAELGICTQLLNHYGTEAQQEKYLPRIAKGEILTGISITEPDAGSATTHITTNVTKVKNGLCLKGRKAMTSRAGECGVYMVFSRFNGTPGLDGIGCVLVDAETPGLSFGKSEEMMGFRGCPSKEVIFEDCPLSENDILVPEGGFRKIMSAFNGQRCLNAAISVGIAQGAFDAAVDYVQVRKPYGHPVSDFQGIRWMISDMAAQIEAARLLTYRAAMNGAVGFPSRFESSSAKLFANEVTLKVTDWALQMHGGWGYNKEFPIERFVRDARGIVLGSGPPQLHRNMIAYEVLKGRATWANNVGE
jgi:alkylation response protein AidB-like acyl-CoA dehydrogenase